MTRKSKHGASNRQIEMVVDGSLEYWLSKIRDLEHQGRITVNSFPVSANMREVEITSATIAARTRTITLQGELTYNPHNETTTIYVSTSPFWETIILHVVAFVILTIAILISTTPTLGIVLMMTIIALPLLFASFYVRSAIYDGDCAQLLDKLQLLINRSKT